MGLQISEVSICNQALSWLGQPGITSLEDDNNSAKLGKANYEPLRNTMLEQRHWTFSTLRHTSETADEPEFGMGFRHPIPSEYLRVSRVYNDVNSFDMNRWRTAVGWRREGDHIIARESIIFMWGTEEITDTNRFSMNFVQCLAGRIAADICMGVTENPTLQTEMYKLYLAKLSDAAALDGAQGSSEKIQANTLIDVRGRVDGGLGRR